MFVKTIKLDDIAPGGLRSVVISGHGVVLGNYQGKIYAIERRCSHMGASFESGTLNGWILTCPLHFAQFDITTGEKLSGPVPDRWDNRTSVAMASNKETHDLKTYKVKIEGNDVLVDV